jgi:C-terminal processing protease CtpA/Prc
MKRLTSLFSKSILTALIIFLLGAGAGYGLFYLNTDSQSSQINQQLDPQSAFLHEVFTSIQENYWEEIGDEALSNLFVLGTQKLTGQPTSTKEHTLESVLTMTNRAMREMDEDEKNQFVVDLSSIVLANLSPFGRSGLYTSKQEQELQEMVQNINTDTDLYDVIGVEPGADTSKVEEKYLEATQKLEGEQSPEAQEKLRQLAYAKDVLTDDQKKQNYDTYGVEPTVLTKQVSPEVFYMYIQRFSPTTFDEFVTAANKAEVSAQAGTASRADSLVLDLRGNIGGAIDILPYILGPFIGENQYAYEFFHRGEYTPFKTTFGWLPSLYRYKKVVILTDGETQSTGEMMAATLKRYNVGVVLGRPTKGWGTVERVFPLQSQLTPNETYSMFLVHSLTLREDNQPIEGEGVHPLISIDDKDWKNQLRAYFNHQPLIDTVEKIWQDGPPKM